MRDYRAILSIDFDKTVGDTDFPTIHGLHDNCREACGRLHDIHDCWIGLWTCRQERHLEPVVDFLAEVGFEYNSLNEQHPNIPKIFGYDARKMGADIYVEDKDVYAQHNPNFPDWLEIERLVIDIINRPNFFSLLRHTL
jgi:hypothetical protein